MSSDWPKKQYLLAWIFNVGRGNCTFVLTPSKYGLLIDCGGEEKIITSLIKRIFPYCRKYKWGQDKETGVCQVIISHPHVDHFQNIEKAIELNPYFWTCPQHDKLPLEGYPDERLDWDLVENKGDAEELEELYKSAYAENRRNLPLQTFVPTSQIPHFSYGIFYIPPPQCESISKSDYANNTSIMAYFWFNNNSILFPGDMMSSGMKRSLEVGCENRLVGEGTAEQFAKRSASAETLRKWINGGCSVLVAPHHGLESAYSPEFFASLPAEDPRVGLVVISEKSRPGEREGNIHQNYQDVKTNKVKGMEIIKDDGTREKNRLSVTTRADGHCLVGFRGTDEVSVVVSQDLDWILTKGPERLFN